MSINDFKKGVKSVTEPLNIKLKEMEEQLNEGIKEVKSGVKINSAVNQQIINILEEQDSRIQDIENFNNFALSSKENINCLNETDKRVLLGIMYDYIQKFDSNFYQKKYFLNVSKCLRVFDFERVDVEKLENVDSMKTQIIIFQILNELAFLKNCSLDFSDDEEEFFSNFMLSAKKKQEIKTKIFDFYNTFGAVAIIDKYESIEVDYQKQRYEPLTLEIKLKSYYSSFQIQELNYNDYSIWSQNFDNVHKKYPSGFDSIIERVLKPYHQKAFNILYNINDDNFIGKRIAQYYSDDINKQIGIIQDFLQSIPELNIEIQGLNELKEKSYDSILDFCKSEQSSTIQLFTSDFERYSLTIKPSESSHLVDSFFGGLKSVTDYSVDLTDLLGFEQLIVKDFKRAEESCAKSIRYQIDNMYIDRLNSIVELINSRLPK